MTKPIDLKAIADRRYRITYDPSRAIDGSRESQLWYARIPCRYGFIGVRGASKLLAYCKATRVIPRLLAIPGVEPLQVGDREINVSFPPECLESVAKLLQARHRRQISPEERSALIERLPGRTQSEQTDAPSDPQGGVA